jgi:hypothetical protein
MPEATVREFMHVHKGAVKVEGSAEIRKPVGSMSAFQQSPKGSSTRG